MYVLYVGICIVVGCVSDRLVLRMSLVMIVSVRQLDDVCAWYVDFHFPHTLPPTIESATHCCFSCSARNGRITGNEHEHRTHIQWNCDYLRSTEQDKEKEKNKLRIVLAAHCSFASFGIAFLLPEISFGTKSFTSSHDIVHPERKYWIN